LFLQFLLYRQQRFIASCELKRQFPDFVVLRISEF